MGFCVGCGSGQSQTAFDPLAPLSLRELHRVQQEAIEVCMRNAGFEYTPKVFVEPVGGNYRTVNAIFELSSPDQFGYGIVRSGLVVALAPLGQPVFTGSESRQEVASYDHQLLGAGDQHERSGGCVDVGEEARATANRGREDPFSRDAEHRWADFMGRVQAAPEYRDYLASWRDCLNESGHLPEGVNSPSEMGFAVGKTIRSAVDAEIDRLSAAETDPNGVLTRARQARVLDSDWFLEVFATYPSLQELVDYEVTFAQLDQSCRSNGRSIVDSTVARLYAEWSEY